MSHRAAALVLAVASLGCSPLLYAILQLRSHGSRGELALGIPVSGSTEAAGDSYAPSCITPDANDEAWSFLAPATGRYRFEVHAGYDSLLAVYRDGQEIGCNDDFGSTRESRLDLSLTQGQRVTVVVDGYHGATGSYTLQVDPSDTPVVLSPTAPPVNVPIPADGPGMAARCETAPVLAPGLLTGSVDHNVHTASVTCGSHGLGGDVVYRFATEVPGSLSVYENSLFDAIIELRQGCGADHRVVACNDDAPDTRHASITTALTPGTYYLVVDSYNVAGEGPFALLVSWTPTVPMQQPPPEIVQGGELLQTTGASAVLRGPGR